MTTDNQIPDWCRGIICKRTPDSLRILTDLIEAGLKKGECSANDIQEMELSQPNIIGACFKVLPAVGFRHTDRRVKTTARRKHARRVDVWELADRGRANQFLTHVRAQLWNQPEPQMSLFEQGP